MLGAIVGDIVGSVYEGRPVKHKNFRWFAAGSRATDDSVLTLAVAQALMDWEKDQEQEPLASHVVACLQSFGRRYPNAGYGGNFYRWIFSEEPTPYGSYGNGSAMRVSPVAWWAKSLEEAIDLAETTAAVTHDHPEGIKGAKATVAATFLARTGQSKEAIADFVSEHYYDLGFTLAEIRPSYRFEVSCQGSVPQAIKAFLEADSFEDAINNAISLGGDADTQAAIAGSIAEGYWGVPEALKEQATAYLDGKMQTVLEQFADQLQPGER